MLRNLRLLHLGFLVLGLVLVLVTVAGIMGVKQREEIYPGLSDTLKAQYLASVAAAAHREVALVVDHIRQRQLTALRSANALAKVRATSEYAVAERLYSTYHNSVPTDSLKREILTALLAMIEADPRVGGFVYSLDTHRSLAARNPVEAKSAVDSPNLSAIPVVSSSRVFEPYHWLIGASVSTKALFEESRGGMRGLVHTARFSNELHLDLLSLSFNLFALGRHGTGLEAGTGLAPDDYPDVMKSQSFIRTLALAAEESSGDVGSGNGAGTNDIASVPIGYFEAIPYWSSIVTAQVDRTAVAARLAAIDSFMAGTANRARSAAVVMFLLTILLIAALVFAYLATSRALNRFTAEFLSVTSTMEPIDIDNLLFREFKHSAANVNKILEDRKRIDESLRSSEERLLRIQKMEAVGRLAGGIAHDFNNLLTVIIGHADLALMNPDLGSLGRTSLQHVRESASQAAKLTHQLLAFSKRQVLRPTVVDPNRLLEGLKKMLLPIIGENITLEIEPDPNSGCFSADEGQIEQVILNLVINARDALPDGGTINIRTKSIVLEESLFPGELPLVAGSYVVVEVSDDGIGMDQETLGHVFEPFFTTKEAGKGTGLGLSTAYGIVAQSGGHIAVRSEPGRGSLFRLFFPTATGGEVRKDETESTDAPRGENETILVVEDEQSVRKMVVSTLRRAGYQTLEANGGLEALKICNGPAGSRIDLILSDVIMSDMTGDQLAERLPARHSETPMLYMTGYGGRRNLGNRPVLYKPFSPSVVSTRIRELLDAQRARTKGRRDLEWTT